MAEAKRKLAAILSADVAGYSRLMRDDEAVTVEILTKYRRVFTDHTARRDGRVVDSPGDNLLAACDGNVRESARRAGVNAVTMYRLPRKRGLRLSREVRSDVGAKPASNGAATPLDASLLGPESQV